MNRYMIWYTQRASATVIGESVKDAIQNFEDGHYSAEDLKVASIEEVVKVDEVED